MQLYSFPKRDEWPELIRRPQKSAAIAEEQVRMALDAVRKNGDAALKRFIQKYENVALNDLMVRADEFDVAAGKVSAELKTAIRFAIDNITKFHKSQLSAEPVVETQPGVSCWRRSVPIEKVGLYIPGGTAPLFSTVLMLAIPARIVGCSEIIMCTPAAEDGSVNPVILYVAKELGVTKIFKIGGAQAVAAMAYGTESVPRVDKIFGPGNSWVTLAKQLVSHDGVAIDMPAGPSEVAVVADETANPEFVAVDLLSQAEHGTDSQVMLVTDSESLAAEVLTTLRRQLQELPRREIAAKALENSRIILLSDSAEMMDFVNDYAPEHLIIMTQNAADLAEQVVNAGSVFIGAYTPESAGDYASGTNHTLPTYGYARSYSGVSVDSFVKKITFQSLSGSGLRAIGPAIESMAAAEGLEAHKNAVALRLAALDTEFRDV